MSLSAFFACIVSAVLAVVGLAAAVNTRRQSRAYERLARTRTFHCLRCDCVYTAPASAEVQPCPNCGYKNARLSF